MGAKHKGKGNRLYRCIAQCMPAPRTPGEALGELDLGTRMHSAQNRSGDVQVHSAHDSAHPSLLR